MKNFKMLLSAMVLFGSFAAHADERSPKEEALLKFDLASRPQTRLTDARLVNLIESFAESGYTKGDDTEAVLVAGGCGVAGCSSTYLVSKAYSTVGVNTRTTSVLAVVVVDPFNGTKIAQVFPAQALQSVGTEAQE